MNRLQIACIVFCISSIAQCIVYAQDSSYSMQSLPLAGSVNIYERGIDKNHLVIAECYATSQALKYYCTATIRLANGTSKQCIYYSTNRAIALQSIDQLTSSRLVVKWTESWLPYVGAKFYEYLDKIAVVDVNACRVMTIIEQPNKLQKTVFAFNDGFDVLMTSESCNSQYMCLQSYNFDGNKFGFPLSLPLRNLDKTAMFAVSRESHWRGFYVYDGRTLNTIYLQSTDIVRRALDKLNYAAVVDVGDDNSFAVCGLGTDALTNDQDLECQQYYPNKAGVFVSQPRGSYVRAVYWFLSVRGLKSGGMVLFGLITGSDTLLDVVEMRPGELLYHQRHEIVSPSGGNVKVMDIDENEGTFTLVYLSGDKRYSPNLILYKSLLPSRFQGRH